MIIKRDCDYTVKHVNRRLHIYLPDDYWESSERYPVMYFFDGHNLFYDEDATYGKSWGLKDFMDQWSKKMIIVGMECGHEGKERLSEYSPYTMNTYFAGKIEGIGDETFKWIINEVKPMIDREYRTYSHREATGIAGSSMGGLMAVYGVTVYNDIFSKGACLSSAVTPCMALIERDLKKQRISPDTRVYFSWGTNEVKQAKDPMKTSMGRAHKRIINTLESQGAACLLYIQPDGRHCEADWEKQIPVFMDHLWMR